MRYRDNPKYQSHAGSEGKEGRGKALLIAEAENALAAAGACHLARTQGVWTSLEKAEGRVARKHRAIEAIVKVRGRECSSDGCFF